MTLLFATGNPGKASEAKEILGDVERVDCDYVEVQSNSLAEIAERGARECHERLGRPVFVDDSGLFVDAYDGFPGPYSSYVYDTLGNEGLLDLMDDVDGRSAEFRCVVAYCDGDVRSFEGVSRGRISREPRGEGGFGYDPVFEHESGETYAEMDASRKNEVSHRRKALESFADWYTEG
ncbi:MAG: XTP/dITP diphosphatase [Halobacteriota archaeon]